MSTVPNALIGFCNSIVAIIQQIINIFSPILTAFNINLPDITSVCLLLM